MSNKRKVFVIVPVWGERYFSKFLETSSYWFLGLNDEILLDFEFELCIYTNRKSIKLFDNIEDFFNKVKVNVIEISSFSDNSYASMAKSHQAGLDYAHTNSGIAILLCADAFISKNAIFKAVYEIENHKKIVLVPPFRIEYDEIKNDFSSLGELYELSSEFILSKYLHSSEKKIPSSFQAVGWPGLFTWVKNDGGLRHTFYYNFFAVDCREEWNLKGRTLDNIPLDDFIDSWDKSVSIIKDLSEVFIFDLADKEFSFFMKEDINIDYSYLFSWKCISNVDDWQWSQLKSPIYWGCNEGLDSISDEFVKNCQIIENKKINEIFHVIKKANYDRYYLNGLINFDHFIKRISILLNMDPEKTVLYGLGETFFLADYFEDLSRFRFYDSSEDKMVFFGEVFEMYSGLDKDVTFVPMSLDSEALIANAIKEKFGNDSKVEIIGWRG